MLLGCSMAVPELCISCHTLRPLASSISGFRVKGLGFIGFEHESSTCKGIIMLDNPTSAHPSST